MTKVLPTSASITAIREAAHPSTCRRVLDLTGGVGVGAVRDIPDYEAARIDRPSQRRTDIADNEGLWNPLSLEDVDGDGRPAPWRRPQEGQGLGMDAVHVRRQMKPSSGDLERHRPVVHRRDLRASAAQAGRQGSAGGAEQEHVRRPMQLSRHRFDVTKEIIAHCVNVCVERPSVDIEARACGAVFVNADRSAAFMMLEQHSQRSRPAFAEWTSNNAARLNDLRTCAWFTS